MSIAITLDVSKIAARLEQAGAVSTLAYEEAQILHEVLSSHTRASGQEWQAHANALHALQAQVQKNALSAVTKAELAEHGKLQQERTASSRLLKYSPASCQGSLVMSASWAHL